MCPVVDQVAALTDVSSSARLRYLRGIEHQSRKARKIKGDRTVPLCLWIHANDRQMVGGNL